MKAILAKALFPTASLTIAFGLLSPSANAQGFEYIPPTEVPSVKTGPAISGLQKGLVHGFGNAIPLETAMLQITPGDIVVSYDRRVDRSIPVDWRGGAEWQVIADEIARVNGLQMARVGRQLIVAPAGTLIVDLLDNQRIDWISSSADVHQAGSQFPAVPTSELVTQTTLWEAPAGRTLREVLESWADQDPEWRVHWEASASYPLSAGHTFEGTFEEAATELLNAFEFARPRLIPFKTANKIFVIQNAESDRSFQ